MLHSCMIIYHFAAQVQLQRPELWRGMAGGGVIAPDNKVKSYNGRLTWWALLSSTCSYRSWHKSVCLSKLRCICIHSRRRVVLTCIVASTGGLLFG